MLDLETAGRGKSLADGTDCQGAAVQHAKRGIAKGVDALSVQIRLQHAAENVVNCPVREPLPDDHNTPESLSGGRIAGLQGSGNRPGSDARIHQLQRLQDSFVDRPMVDRFFYVVRKMRGGVSATTANAVLTTMHSLDPHGVCRTLVLTVAGCH